MDGAGLPQNDLGPTALLVKLVRKILLDLTQDELSARSGVNADLISRYENGAIRQPTPRNLDRLLSAADALDLKEPLLFAADHLSTLLSPPPPSPAPAGDDPLRIRDLVQQTSRRQYLTQTQTDSRFLTGEYSPPVRRDLLPARFCPVFFGRSFSAATSASCRAVPAFTGTCSPAMKPAVSGSRARPTWTACSPRRRCFI